MLAIVLLVGPDVTLIPAERQARNDGRHVGQVLLHGKCTQPRGQERGSAALQSRNSQLVPRGAPKTKTSSS